MDTYFASPQRADPQELTRQIETVHSSAILNSLLTIVDGLLAVLNEHRQIIALNENLLSMLGIDDAKTALGLRPGEAIRCIHAHEMPGGCGTSEYCSTCGAAIAIVTSLSHDRPVEKTCAVSVKKNKENKDLYFRVRAQPLKIEGQKLILLFLQDITRQQQWAVVERIFFHDINNIIHGLVNASQLLSDQQPRNHLVHIIQKLSTQISNEVAIQNYINKKGISDYKPVFTEVTAEQVFAEISKTVTKHPCAENNLLVFSKPVPFIKLNTNMALLCRVLVNMLINAFEASTAGDTVKVSINNDKNQITFNVWNKQPIPKETAKRIFQRNFSTKGEMGRGLGTYSMKLMGETLLGGKVTFSTSESDGTTFHFSLPI